MSTKDTPLWRVVRQYHVSLTEFGRFGGNLQSPEEKKPDFVKIYSIIRAASASIASISIRAFSSLASVSMIS